MRRQISLVRAAAVLTVAVVGLGLAACSGDGGSNAAAGTNKLTVVAWKGKGANEADMPALNKAFEKAYPDVKLDYTYVDSANYDAYMNPRLTAGTAADVMMVDRVHMNEWAKQGFLADLSGQPWVKRMFPNLAPFNQVGGKTYQFNAETIPIGLFVNNDLLKSAGIDSAPTTWASFLDDLKTLKSQGKNGLILPNKGGWIGEQLALLLAPQHVKADWPAQYDAGKAKFSPQWLPVADQIKQLFSSGVVDPTTAMGLDPNVDGLPQFEAGKWAFMIQGAWSLSSIQQASKFDVSLNAFPGGSDAPKAFNFVGSGWAMNTKAKNQKAAEEYIDFLSQPAQAARFLKAESAFTTLKDVPSPAISGADPIKKAMDSGDIVPSMAQELNASDAEVGIQKGIENIFINPGAPSSSTLQLLDSLVKPTPAG